MDIHEAVVTISVIVVFILVVLLLTDRKCGCQKKMAIDHFHDGVISRDHFDVYLINLEKNKDRLQAFVDQYKASDLAFKNFFRYNAMDGSKINIQDYVSPRAHDEITQAEDSGYRMRHYQLTRGGVGCYLSHQNVLRIIRDSDKKFGIVFEDDAIIDPKIYSKMAKVMLEIPTDWDILLLGCYCIKCIKYEKHADMKRFWFLHGYVVSKESAKRILDHLDKSLIEQQIDTVFSDMIAKGDLKVYCLNNELAKQNSSFKTTIQLPIKYKSDIDPYESIKSV